MIEALQYLVDMVVSVVTMIVDLIGSLIASIGFLLQGLQYINTIMFILPGGLLIFALAFLAIFIVNRLSFGSNGGD